MYSKTLGMLFFLSLLPNFLINKDIFVNGEKCLLSQHPDYDYSVEYTLNNVITLDFSIIDDSSDGTNDLLSVQLTLTETAWIGFGLSETGGMIGSEAIIGLPDEPQGSTNPGKYDLQGKSTSNVVLMDTSHQTLIDASITQDSASTIMRFKKKLIEDDEIIIDRYGVSRFLSAYGYSNTLYYHKVRNAFTVDFSECYSLRSKCKDEEIL